MAAGNPGGETRASHLQEIERSFFLLQFSFASRAFRSVLFRVSHEGLSERGTTRSLGYWPTEVLFFVYGPRRINSQKKRGHIKAS